jgi:hypothetical protein
MFTVGLHTEVGQLPNVLSQARPVEPDLAHDALYQAP